jgi:anti-anti-sigma regulatory factor
VSDPTSVDRLQLGDHVCWTYDDDEQCLDATARFVTAGLRAGHQVLCVTEALLPVTLLEALRTRGVPVQRALDTGQLRASAATEAHPPADRAEVLLKEIVRAGENGHAGLRVVDDMSWALHFDHLTCFETRLGRLLLDGGAALLCQYDRRRFDRDRLRQVSAVHPATAAPVHDAGWEPMLRLHRTVDPPGLRLVGEVDVSNRGALAHALDAFADAETPVTIDVAGLTFIDAAGAGLIVRAAGWVPHAIRIVGASPLVRKVLTLVSAGAPGVVVV